MDFYIAILYLPSLMKFASGKEMCDYPPDSSITDLAAYKFLVGTELTYSCDPDHYAGVMSGFSYKCDNSNGPNKWISEDLCYCHKYHRTMTNKEIRKESSDCEVSTYVNGSIPRDHCGPPPTVMNANLVWDESTFPIGQEFSYSFQCDQNRTHGVLKCQDSSGSIAWIKLFDGCSYKSNGSHQAEVTKCTGVYTHCIIVAVGAITVIMVIFAIYKITQWRIKSTGKCKFLQRNSMPAQKEEDINAVHVPLNEKQ